MQAYLLHLSNILSIIFCTLGISFLL